MTATESAPASASAPAANQFGLPIQLPFVIEAGRWPSAITAIWSAAVLALLMRIGFSYAALQQRKSRAFPAAADLAGHVTAWLAVCRSRFHSCP